jgi:recombinational DNA repair ATPase RecF
MAEAFSTTSRRTLLGRIAAAPVIGVTAAATNAAAHHATSPLPAYWQQRERLMLQRQILRALKDYDALDALWDPIFAVEEQIVKCRSASLQDLQIKAAVANDLLADSSEEEEITHPILLSIFRDVERMLLTGVPA